MVPLFEELANVYKDDDNIVIANVDLTKDQDIGVQMGITGLPTMMLFGINAKQKPKTDADANASTPKKLASLYKGSRDLSSLVDFLNKETEAKRDIDGSLSTTHGVSALFDHLMDDFLSFKMGSKEQKEFLKKLLSENEGDEEISIVTRALTQLIDDKGISFLKNEYERLNRLIVAEKIERYMNLFFISRRNLLRRIIERLENEKIDL